MMMFREVVGASESDVLGRATYTFIADFELDNIRGPVRPQDTGR